MTTEGIALVESSFLSEPLVSARVKMLAVLRFAEGGRSLFLFSMRNLKK